MHRKVAKEAVQNVGLTQFLVSARYVADPDKLTNELRQFKGLSVTITSYAGDPEAHGLCTSLLYFMNKAEMQPTDLCGRQMASGQLLTDVGVFGPDDKTVLGLQGAIFRDGRFGVSTGPLGNASKPQTYEVFVGVKPPFRIGPALGPLAHAKQTKPKNK